MTAVALYWLALGVAAYRYRIRPLQPSPPLPPASLLVAVHNDAEALSRLLEQLAQLHYPAPWEVLIAADRCTDDTLRHLQQADPALPLRWIAIPSVPVGWSPKKYALWRLSSMARYEWCVLLDADSEIPKDWLVRLLQTTPQASAIVAPAWLVGQKRLSSRLAAYEGNLVQVEAVGRAAWGVPYMGTGRGWAIRQTWLRAGLFLWRSELSGDDDLVLQLLPRRAIRLSWAPSHSVAPVDFRRALHRKWRHLQTARHYPWRLRLSLAAAPALHLTGTLLSLLHPISWPALLLPPLAKALSLYLLRAPSPFTALWADLPLLALQTLYPIGTTLRKKTWLWTIFA